MHELDIITVFQARNISHHQLSLWPSQSVFLIQPFLFMTAVTPCPFQALVLSCPSQPAYLSGFPLGPWQSSWHAAARSICFPHVTVLPPKYVAASFCPSHGLKKNRDVYMIAVVCLFSYWWYEFCNTFPVSWTLFLQAPSPYIWGVITHTGGDVTW